MIPSQIIKKIKRIHIKSGRVVNTLMAGQYRSVFKGSGIEFEQVREYSPGDDVKALDWKVSARMGKPFIKVYREERESIVMLLVDMSASLKFGTFNGTKLERAAEVASVLAFNAIKNNDKVGIIFFTDRVEKYIPPQKGAGHIWRLIKEIFTFVPEGSGTSIASALDYCGRISKKRSLVFILSDFFDQNYLNSLKALRRQHEIIGVNIYDPGLFNLPAKAIVTLRDFETGKTMLFDTFRKKVRNRFKSIRMADQEKTRQIFSKARSDLIDMGTQVSISGTLLKYFKLRERRK